MAPHASRHWPAIALPCPRPTAHTAAIAADVVDAARSGPAHSTPRRTCLSDDHSRPTTAWQAPSTPVGIRSSRVIMRAATSAGASQRCRFTPMPRTTVLSVPPSLAPSARITRRSLQPGGAGPPRPELSAADVRGRSDADGRPRRTITSLGHFSSTAALTDVADGRDDSDTGHQRHECRGGRRSVGANGGPTIGAQERRQIEAMCRRRVPGGSAPPSSRGLFASDDGVPLWGAVERSPCHVVVGRTGRGRRNMLPERAGIHAGRRDAVRTAASHVARSVLTERE